ncbi:MAG: hypothetical protein QM802_03460 [Agriterribacter sp.]
MYYILLSNIENDESDAILEGQSKYLDQIECSFQDGISLPVDDIDVPIIFHINKNTLRGIMTDHLNINDIPGPVLSLETKELFTELSIDNIEYYQLKLLDAFPNGNKEPLEKPFEYNNYFIANVVGLVDCVDHEKSILEYFYPPELRNPPEDMPPMEDDENNPFAGENPNDIDFVTKLVLDESKIDPDLKIFRLYDKPSLLIFHESIVEKLRKEEATGFVFVSVEDYTEVLPDDNSTIVNEELEQKDIYQVFQGKEYSKEEWRNYLMNEAAK